MPADRSYHRAIFNTLKKTYPDAHCELDYETPLELVVATILSAQCTDRRVNLVTPALFQRYPSAEAFASADRSELESLIASTGFFRNKATSIMGMAQAVCANHGGQIPGSLEALVQLPGVGRKTANVILGNAFGVPGITVDTHFGRLARRFGWTTESDPVKIEFEIQRLFPAKDWTMLSHVLVWHGRRCCHARKPACGACPVAKYCPAFGEGPTDRDEAAALLRTEGRL